MFVCTRLACYRVLVSAASLVGISRCKVYGCEAKVTDKREEELGYFQTNHVPVHRCGVGV